MSVVPGLGAHLTLSIAYIINVLREPYGNLTEIYQPGLSDG